MFDVDAQKKIMDQIRLENIAQNMEVIFLFNVFNCLKSAMEHHPESFGRVMIHFEEFFYV